MENELRTISSNNIYDGEIVTFYNKKYQFIKCNNESCPGCGFDDFGASGYQPSGCPNDECSKCAFDDDADVCVIANCDSGGHFKEVNTKKNIQVPMSEEYNSSERVIALQEMIKIANVHCTIIVEILKAELKTELKNNK